jgi:hypothetical protein
MTHVTPRCPFPTLADQLLTEGVLSIVAAAAAEGIAISAKTGLRWAIHGTRGAKLESIRIGGRRVTSRAAIRRFVGWQQSDPATPSQQGLDRRAADAVLFAHGLGREGCR